MKEMYQINDSDSFVNYLIGGNDLERLLSEVSFNDNNQALFLRFVYCHAITLLDAYVGGLACHHEYLNKKRKMNISYQNPQKIKKFLKQTFGIEFSLPNEYENMVKKRNMFIHKNGISSDEDQITVSKEEVEQVLELVRKSIYEIENKILDKKAEEYINSVYNEL